MARALIRCWTGAVLLFAALPPAIAEERIARTREERRNSGLQFEPTDWLRFSGLIELEALFQRSRRLEDSVADGESEFSGTLELGLEAEPLSWAKAELLYEYDGEHTLDEALLVFEAGDLELELGRLYVPFGEYFSHFVSGPALEFGETRSTGSVLSYEPDDRLRLAAFLHRGRAKGLDSGTADLDWGLAVEGSPFESTTFAVSFLSDLADSNAEPLGDEAHQKRVGAWSAYALFSSGRFEATGELVLALGRFRELEADRDEPRAWNLELAFFPADALELAVRYEGSRELEEAPRTRVGAAASWRVVEHAYLRAEVLWGDYEPGLSADSSGTGLDRAHQIGLQLSLQ